ncbi:MAG: endo alpha-1,4 polygalactosaminidase, partial [Treponema sp.]|nr:endo alpha-1,4 polygalactosaminidase [Treponema sp.]
RDLSLIPSYEPYNKNDDNINKLSDAKNFLYLINPNQKDFPTKEAFISALEQTDYDLFVIDLFSCDQALSADDISRLKIKKNGARRLVICYMSIGEAEDYRWYWQKQWKSNPPAFLCSENPEWKGNYKVKYWYPDWQTIMCG